MKWWVTLDVAQMPGPRVHSAPRHHQSQLRGIFGVYDKLCIVLNSVIFIMEIWIEMRPGRGWDDVDQDCWFPVDFILTISKINSKIFNFYFLISTKRFQPKKAVSLYEIQMIRNSYLPYSRLFILLGPVRRELPLSMACFVLIRFELDWFFKLILKLRIQMAKSFWIKMAKEPRTPRGDFHAFYV